MCVCEPARLDDVLAVCARWEVHGTAIGEVTDTGAMRIFRGDELVGDMPVAALVDDCPVYELAPQRPAAPLYDPPAATLARGGSVHEALLALLASPNLASRRPLFEQYDWIVQSRTVRRPEEADAAVLALPDGGGLGVSIDGNGRRVAADPYQGTIAAMLECAANLACVGAEPLGVTNNLNFGNPEKPHIAWQLDRGGARPGRRLHAPSACRSPAATSRSTTRAPPARSTRRRSSAWSAACPTRGARAASGFAREGDAIALAGWDAAPSLAGGELAKLWGEPLPDGLPAVDLPRARGARGGARRGARRHAELVPRRRRGRLPGRARRVLPGRRPGRRARPRPSDDPGASSSASARRLRPSARATRSTRWRRPCPRRVGTVGGDALELRSPARPRAGRCRAARGPRRFGRFFP